MSNVLKLHDDAAEKGNAEQDGDDKRQLPSERKREEVEEEASRCNKQAKGRDGAAIVGAREREELHSGISLH